MRGDAPRIASLRDVAVTALALALSFAAAKLAWEALERRVIARGHRHRYHDAAGPASEDCAQAGTTFAARAGEG